MRRKRVWQIGCLPLALGTVLVLGLLAQRQAHQQWLDRQLIHAIENNRMETALSLLDVGANPNAQKEPNVSLSWRQWLENRWYRRLPPASLSPSALMMASRIQPRERDTVRLIQQLILHGANADVHDFNVDCYSYPTSPLSAAMYADDAETVRLLIQHGASIQPEGCCDWTPLSYAASIGDIVLMQTCVATGADINFGENLKGTPLHTAALKGQSEAVRWLIARHSDVNAKKDNDITPLFIASGAGHLSIVRLLLEHGANPNAGTFMEGETPLMVVFENRDVKASVKQEIVTELLRHKANVKARSKDGLTILGYIKKMQISVDPAILQLLQQAGAKEQ